MSFKTYNISDFLVSTNQKKHFHINTLEEMPPLPPYIESPHKHAFYEIFLLEKGILRQDVDDKAYQIEAHQLFFIAQGQLHIWHENIDEVKGFRLMFTEDFFQTRQNNTPFLHELLYLNNAYENPFLYINNFAKINVLFEQLFEEYQNQDFKTEVLQAYLFLILNEVQRAYKLHFATVFSNQDLMVYKKILNLVEQKYMTNALASDYAEYLSLTLKQLNRITESVENQTITNIITNRKIIEAKRLLLYTELNIAQISEHLGFEDYSYFNRFFKKNTAQTPGYYRQSKGK
jgi:AraC family transcriptional regulator, transcriptional activator of pobA